MNIKLLFLPFAIVILVWSVISITKPAWDKYKEGKEEVVKLSQEKQKLEQGIVNIKKALGEYQSLDESTKSYVNNAIPMNGNNDNLIAELNKDISQSGVLVAKINSSQKKAKVNPKCNQGGATTKVDCSAKSTITSITLSAVAFYPAIKDFLGKLDIQNRIILPNSVSLATTTKKEDVEDDAASKLITAKLVFDVFHKKPASIKSFSSVMSTDTVLKSLLQGGLSTGGIDAVNKFITSDVFMPVQVAGVGKDNLFE